MGLEDRDWYREETREKNKSNQSYPATPKAHSDLLNAIPRKAFGWSFKAVVIVMLYAVAAAIGRDMKDRGVPISWHGFKWWLSLWFGG